MRFDSEVSAASALAKNGQFVDSSLMIGVVKYDPNRFQVSIVCVRSPSSGRPPLC